MTTNRHITELERKQAAKQDELQRIMSPAKQEDGTYDLKGDALNDVRSLNKELDDIGTQLDDARTTDKAAQYVAEAEARGEATKAGEGVYTEKAEQPSIGKAIADSGAIEHKGQAFDIDIDLKADFETSAGWAPETTRSGRLVESAQRPVQLLDLIPTEPTSQTSYVYMKETTFTNTAAGTAEGAAFNEVALQVDEDDQKVEKITAWLPVTDEQLEDVAQARGYVNRRLPFMVRQSADGLAVTGNGTTPNPLGVVAAAGQTQAKSTDPIPDAVYKAMTKVRVTGRAMPGAVAMHSNDWQRVRLLRTTDGIYIWGSPADAGPARIWGQPVALNEALTEGTAVVGDWANYSLFAVKRGVTVKISDSHADFFVNGKQAIRADMRGAFVWLRPNAFCTVTGLNA